MAFDDLRSFYRRLMSRDNYCGSARKYRRSRTSPPPPTRLDASVKARPRSGLTIFAALPMRGSR